MDFWDTPFVGSNSVPGTKPAPIAGIIKLESVAAWFTVCTSEVYSKYRSFTGQVYT